MMSYLSRILEYGPMREFRAQLNASQRLRWMVFTVGMIFLVYLALVLDDGRVAMADDYRRIAEREAKLESLENIEELDFADFLQEEQATNAALRGRFWLASSEGLAGAEFQSWLRRIATEHRMNKVHMDLAEIRPLSDMQVPLWRMEAELAGDLTPNDARALIAAIAKSQRSVSVEQLSYLPERGDRMTLRLVAHFLIEDGKGGGGG